MANRLKRANRGGDKGNKAAAGQGKAACPWSDRVKEVFPRGDKAGFVTPSRAEIRSKRLP